MTPPTTWGEGTAILLVDDAEANLVALEAALAPFGCALVKARSGNEALRLLLKRSFALILLDVQMPEMDGFEVARLARDNPSTRDIPIIFITAMNQSSEAQLRGYGSGAVDLLFKPVDLFVLRSKVRVFLELHASRRRLAAEVAAHEATIAELETFNYTVSHDLKAPLRPMIGFAKALLEEAGGRLDAEHLDLLRRIEGSARRMSALIDALLAFSRSGREPIRPEPIDLSGVVRGVCDALAAEDPGRQVECAIQPDVSVAGDAVLLGIAVENLVRNAWKFTRTTARPKIEFAVRRARDRLVYVVRDNGVGFDVHAAKGLFKPFKRLHPASQFEGTGIGLATAERIVQRHGGAIWADAAVGAGASFFFTLGADDPALRLEPTLRHGL